MIVKILLFLAFLISCVRFVSAQEVTQHNEVHRALERQAKLLDCHSKDLRYYRSGRYTVESAEIMTPPVFKVVCERNSMPTTVISWDEIQVNGTRAVRHRILILKKDSQFGRFSVDFNSVRTNARLPIPTAVGYDITIEGFDKLGNSVFLQDFNVLAD